MSVPCQASGEPGTLGRGCHRGGNLIHDPAAGGPMPERFDVLVQSVRGLCPDPYARRSGSQDGDREVRDQGGRQPKTRPTATVPVDQLSLGRDGKGLLDERPDVRSDTALAARIPTGRFAMPRGSLTCVQEPRRSRATYGCSVWLPRGTIPPNAHASDELSTAPVWTTTLQHPGRFVVDHRLPFQCAATPVDPAPRSHTLVGEVVPIQ